MGEGEQRFDDFTFKWALDLSLTVDLLLGGLMAELRRAVQVARKDMDCGLTERVDLNYSVTYSNWGKSWPRVGSELDSELRADTLADPNDLPSLDGRTGTVIGLSGLSAEFSLRRKNTQVV